MGRQRHESSGVRQRTRRAILDAAIALWSRDFSASLGDIAERAAVSRSTLHRYFPERQALVDAALAEAVAAIEREGEKALVGCRTAVDELSALMRAGIDNGDAILFLFSDPNRFAGNPYWDESEDEDVLGVITRAQAEGGIAADVTPGWILGVFYSLIYTAAEAIASDQLPRHRAVDVAVRTFLHGVGSGDSGAH